MPLVDLEVVKEMIMTAQGTVKNCLSLYSLTLASHSACTFKSLCTDCNSQNNFEPFKFSKSFQTLGPFTITARNVGLSATNAITY